jgi:hypothetical protein
VERDFAFSPPRGTWITTLASFAETRIEGVGQQDGGNAQTFCFTQRGLPSRCADFCAIITSTSPR